MSLVKRNSYAPAKPVASTVGTGMIVAGAGGLGLLLVAGLLPFITFPVLCVLLVVAGTVVKL